MEQTLSPGNGQLAKAMEKIEAVVRDGLKHGHFKTEIECTLAGKRVRELVVKAGNSYQYRITEEELDAQ
jgi:hypothetical protein